MQTNPLPPSFFDTYSLSTYSLGCNTLCMVISFLVLWSICLSSSLIHIRKGPEYLRRCTTLEFIPLIRFRLETFVSNSFLVPLRYISFLILSFLCTCLIVSASKMPSYLSVYFSPNVLILSWIDSSIPSVRCRFSTFYYKYGTFFYAKFISFVLTVYSNCVY